MTCHCSWCGGCLTSYRAALSCPANAAAAVAALVAVLCCCVLLVLALFIAEVVGRGALAFGHFGHKFGPFWTLWTLWTVQKCPKRSKRSVQSVQKVQRPLASILVSVLRRSSSQENSSSQKSEKFILSCPYFSISRNLFAGFPVLQKTSSFSESL